MIANGIHETSTTGGTGTLTLIAGTGDGELRVADVFADGQAVQYMIKSTTTDKWEEGLGKPGASNTLVRTLPKITYNGTTRDETSPSALDFLSETVDVWITPNSNGSTLNIPNTSAVGAKFLASRHIGDNADNQSKSVLTNRAMVVPYLPEQLGTVSAIREELTVIGTATKYRLAIFEEDIATGGIGLELWQSGDITPAVALTQTTISPAIQLTGVPLYIVVVADAAVTFRAFNRLSSAPTQCGVDPNNMRNVQAFFDDIGAWSTIPSSFTLGTDYGSPVAFQLGYV